jgi:nucleotide-binding universal stress UspA family protein
MARRRPRSARGAGLLSGSTFGIGYGQLGWALLWCLGLAVLYALGTSSLVFLVAGLAWLAAGLAISMVQPLAAARLRKTTAADVVYDQILVPVIGTRLTDEMLVLACQLATEKASSIDALYIVEVPLDRPLDAPLDLERQRAQKIVELATATAGEFGVEARGPVVAARSAGKAIVEVASQRRSEVIFLGAPRKRRAKDSIFGDTVSYVLRQATCEVIVNLVPSGYPMAGSAAEIVLSDPGDSSGQVATDGSERK